MHRVVIRESAGRPSVVLVVEDEAEVRELARVVLEGDGYTVLVARNGEEALQICDREVEPIDLVLSDVVMPRMTGPELVKRLWQSRPAMKVLYISGYADEKTAAAYGFMGPLLRKPFSLDTLARKVREVLEIGAGRASEG